MSFVHKEGHVSIFKNEKKHDAQPDFWGTGRFLHEEFKIAFWKKTDKKGNAFLSGKIEKPKSHAESCHNSSPITNDEPDDDIEF